MQSPPTFKFVAPPLYRTTVRYTAVGLGDCLNFKSKKWGIMERGGDSYDTCKHRRIVIYMIVNHDVMMMAVDV